MVVDIENQLVDDDLNITAVTLSNEMEIRTIREEDEAEESISVENNTPIRFVGASPMVKRNSISIPAPLAQNTPFSQPSFQQQILQLQQQHAAREEETRRRKKEEKRARKAQKRTEKIVQAYMVINALKKGELPQNLAGGTVLPPAMLYPPITAPQEGSNASPALHTDINHGMDLHERNAVAQTNEYIDDRSEPDPAVSSIARASSEQSQLIHRSSSIGSSRSEYSSRSSSRSSAESDDENADINHADSSSDVHSALSEVLSDTSLDDSSEKLTADNASQHYASLQRNSASMYSISSSDLEIWND